MSKILEKFRTEETRVYDYIAIKASPLFERGELFCLDNGYYVNDSESVIIKSCNITGKFIRKIKAHNEK